MNPIRKQRLIFIACIVTCMTLALSLALYALSQNINLFFSPTQVALGQTPKNHVFRLGGLVEKNSVHHLSNHTEITFIVTDNKNKISVDYAGILPDLFREGKSVVVEGKLDSHGVLMASQVLAKHDERYRPIQRTEDRGQKNT
jgi:cytochrome c-type biogenesis protein CcmE